MSSTLSADAGVEGSSACSSPPPPPFAVLKDQTPGKKGLLLAIFCLAFFLDTVNNSALFTGIPAMATQLHIPDSQSVWLLSAYQLTFAAVLLISGRVSDLYNPKWVFVTGALTMGAFSLVDGFLRKEIPIIVLRALMGAGGALTIPSAQHLIVHMYPNPVEQAKAVTVFGGMGAIGIVMGLVIGAIFVTYTSWPWVFYFAAIVSFVVGLSGLVFIPKLNRPDDGHGSRLRRLDIFGVFLFTAASILFIFAVTSGGSDGWKSARVLAPLIISIGLVVAFFVWESRLPEFYAAVPSKIWKIENFAVLIFISFAPFAWWASVFLQFSWLWEVVYEWSAIKTAVHFLPIGLGLFPAIVIFGFLQVKLSLKWVIFTGFSLVCIGTVLLPFVNSPRHFWPFAFPGFLLATIGSAIIYSATNVALLSNTPPAVSGIVSAMFMCVLQMGGALGSAIVTSIQTSVEASYGGATSFAGHAAGLWFLFAFMMAITLVMLVFTKDTMESMASAASKEAAETDVEAKVVGEL